MLTLPAPAKLNLFLHVTGRRPDGYHALQTVFQLLDYGDELRFDPGADALELHCNRPALATDDNLVLRAARLLRPHARRTPNCRIELDKRLPAGGGLGGGSSDAATTLLALDALWDCGLDREQLLHLGAGLGADVPVFLFGHSAWAEGIGERLVKQVIPTRHYLVLTPRCEAETGRIFAHPELTRDSVPIRIPAFPFPGTRNDCQAVATSLHPEIQQALDWLGRFAEARMTGTGSSVFASFDTRAEAQQTLARMPAAFDGFVARGIDDSPLHGALRRQLAARRA